MRSDVDFLPAVLEIQERPPSPAGRAIAWSVIAFFSLAVLWAMFGKIDIVASARGKIVPGGRVKIIQPMEIGVVRAIHVQEGQPVKAGELLVELDPTATEADLEHLDEEMVRAQLDRARYRQLGYLAEAAASGDQVDKEAVAGQFAATTVAGATPDERALQQRLLKSQWAKQQAQLAALDSAIASREAELDATREEVKKLEATLPLVSKRANAIKGLVEKKLSAAQPWLELEEKRVGQQHELAVLKSRVKQVASSLQQVIRQRQGAEAEFLRKQFSDLADTDQHIQQLEQERIKARQRTRLRRITAPVPGVVQQLAVHTIGGVVTPAQKLMKLVPESQRLEVEAWILNKDIGFVQAGQTAEVKVATFPFTKYGTIDAEVVNVSNDAMTDEQKRLVYAARVLLKRTNILVGKKRINLTPGMEVTVEVKTGKRRLIEYILSPLLRYKQDSFGER